MNNINETIKSRVQDLIKNNTNPMIRDLIIKAQNGDSKGVETFARNFCNEKGIDFDKEFAQFMSNFKK